MRKCVKCKFRFFSYPFWFVSVNAAFYLSLYFMVMKMTETSHDLIHCICNCSLHLHVAYDLCDNMAKR